MPSHYCADCGVKTTCSSCYGEGHKLDNLQNQTRHGSIAMRHNMVSSALGVDGRRRLGQLIP